MALDPMLDVHLDRLAIRQHGLVTRAQALDLGCTPSAIKHRVRVGRWTAERRGVYRLAGTPRTWTQAVLAAVLASPQATWATELTSARLWGCPGAAPSDIELVSERHQRVRMAGVRAHESHLWHPSDRTVRDGVPVTSLARTLVDVSARVGPVTTAEWMDEAVRRGVLRYDDVRASVARLAGPGRRRLTVVRDVLAHRIPGYDPGESNLEVRALAVLGAAGLPPPVQQHEVRLPTGRRARIDLAYPRWMLAIELDGFRWHADRSAFDADRARANELVAAGWTVLRFTSRTPDAEIVDRVTEILRRTIPRSDPAFASFEAALRP